MLHSSKQRTVEAGRQAVLKAQKAVGNINAHEGDRKAQLNKKA
ncbi:hypothetical protein [Halalkalibacter wakoensis]|nr:hypothetical protein [Halalkalibacter wakoensis]